MNVNRLRSVIGFGVGAGANILARFAVSMNYFYCVLYLIYNIVKRHVFRFYSIIFEKLNYCTFIASCMSWMLMIQTIRILCVKDNNASGIACFDQTFVHNICN